jgi:hypothetical protein
VSAERILDVMNAETELDQNTAGHEAAIEGRIEFRNVGFRYADDGEAVIDDLSFVAEPGETIAIVGETGSGKSTLTKLVNRIYDADEGEILIDGVDVRRWNLTSLRSQISTIEQEIVLFSRPVAENIAFSLGQRADMAEIERAAREAQAHEFILELKDGYETVIGERGRDPVGWAAAAARDRPGTADRPPDPDPRRLDERGRQCDGGPDPAGDRPGDHGPDDAPDHASPEPDTLVRQGARDPARSLRRLRPARGAAGPVGAVPADLLALRRGREKERRGGTKGTDGVRGGRHRRWISTCDGLVRPLSPPSLLPPRDGESG